MSHTIEEIERLAKTYADAVLESKEELDDLIALLADVKEQRIRRIRYLAGKVKSFKAELENAVGGSPALFEKPRTVVFHGIRIGFQKGKGKIEFDDPAKVCELIARHFPEQSAGLIKTTLTPIKDMLAGLATADLKRIGCTVKDAGDEVVVRPIDGDVEKMFEALLKEEKK